MLNGLHEELTAIQIMETMNDHINRIQ